MISVLIRCSDDYRVLECINSVLKTSPTTLIIVSMTPNYSLRKAISKTGASCCIVPKYNAAITNNRGLKLVKKGKVIITDADTIFETGAIKQLSNALGKYDVAKPRLVFRSKNKFPYFSTIANLRTFFNDNKTKMYIPGLSFNLNIKNKIGGYYFDEKIPWGEDSEFSDRVNKHNLRTAVIKNSILYHPTVDLAHDLADAFLIGSKKQEKDIKNTKSSKRLKIYKKILSSYGVLTLFYGMLWYLLFDLGKMLRKTVPGQKKTELLSWKILSRR